MPLFGPPNIEKLLAKRNTKGLIKALQDAKSRCEAAVALGKIRDPLAVSSLINTLWDPDPKVQQAAAVALGEIGDSSATLALMDALKNRDISVRQAAAEALGKVCKGEDFWPEDFPDNPLIALIAALKDMPKVHEAAFKALVEIGKPAVPVLVALLKHKDPQLRCYALNVLGEIRDARTVELIVSSLYESDRGVRICAAEALGSIGDGRAVEGLIDTLKYQDKEGSVHRAAAQALKRLGWQPQLNQLGAIYWIAFRQWDPCVKVGKSAVRPLTALLKNDNASIRKNAAESLGKIGDARAVEPLIAILRDRDKAVQDAAMDALGEIGDSRALNSLLTALTRDRQVRAAKALVDIGEPAVEPLIQVLKHSSSGVRLEAAKALGKIGDPRAVEPLIETLSLRDETVCAAAAFALGQINDARAVEPLIKTLGHEGRFVRKSAAEALINAYKSGKLDDEKKRLIFAKRDTITRQHKDGRSHSDTGCTGAGTHEDDSWHSDYGIGVKF